MSKHTNHTNWDMHKCECHGGDELLDYESQTLLHEEYVELKSTVLDLLQSLDAEDQLKNGFSGMGYNIVQETASKKRMHIRRLRGMVGEDQG
jgi:hypothetical protein